MKDDLHFFVNSVWEKKTIPTLWQKALIKMKIRNLLFFWTGTLLLIFKDLKPILSNSVFLCFFIFAVKLGCFIVNTFFHMLQTLKLNSEKRKNFAFTQKKSLVDCLLELILSNFFNLLMHIYFLFLLLSLAISWKMCAFFSNVANVQA